MDDADEPEDELAQRRESGGARGTKRKHDERNTRRQRAKWTEKEYRDRYRALGRAPTDVENIHEWLVKVHALLVEEAVTDPGPPPEQRREQVGRLSSQLTKVVDLAKLSASLAAYERAMEELKAGGAQVDPGTDGGAKPPAPQR